MLSDLNRDQSQMISLTAVDVAMNSASTVGSATEVCFFDPQEIPPPSIRITYPDVDFLSALFPAQSESTNMIGGEFSVFWALKLSLY